MPHHDDYVKQIEAENEKLREHIEKVETENLKLSNECKSMSYHYDRGEVRLVSILIGNKKSGYVNVPVFSHSRQVECVKFIDTHYEQYWKFSDIKKKIGEILKIKRVNIMYQITMISGAQNKKINNKDWYYGFKIFENRNEAMYYDPRKKSFNTTFKPT